MTPQGTEPELPECPESLVEGWVDSGLLQGQGHRIQHASISPFEGGHHCHYYPYRSLASGQTRGVECNSAHQQKIGLKIY